MDQNKRQDIALMRYSVIAPLITGTLPDGQSKEAFFRDASSRGIPGSDGRVRHYSPSAIKHWYQDYQHSGFEGLLPSSRSDCGKSRSIDEELADEIRHLRHSYPRLSAAAIYRQLLDKGSIRPGDLCESTVCRFINSMIGEEKLSNSQDMRRYERPHINEVWCGDSSAGPSLKTADGKKHRVYIIALIDDASRFITGIDVFFNDTFVNLMSVMRSAISKYGKPRVFNFDNGAAYRNKQMELLAARIGSAIRYCRPYSPTQKAKIERWFRTLKDHWMASLDMRDFHSLDELRASLHAYVLQYNQAAHSSLHGKSPQERFFSEPECIRRIPDEQIGQSFLLETRRRVSPDCVLVIDQTEYEVDSRFAKRNVTLRYAPDMGEVYVVESDGALSPVRLLDKQGNASVKREKVRLTGGEV